MAYTATKTGQHDLTPGRDILKRNIPSESAPTVSQGHYHVAGFQACECFEKHGPGGNNK